MVRLPLRTVIDTAAACLLLAGLAYWWLGNTAHELIGTGMFLLLLSHLALHRRWFARLPLTGRQSRGRLMIGLNILFAATMAALLVSSIVVSRTVFGALPFDAGPMARTIHLLAAYWVMVLAGLHIGMNWHLVQSFARPRLPRPLRAPLAKGIGWAVVAAIAGLGLMGALSMNLGPKLINRPTLDMWDFTTQTPLFFLNWLAIVGLFAVLGHQCSNLLLWQDRRRARHGARVLT